MAKSRKSEFLRAKKFLSRLQAVVEALPTEAEKAEAKERIQALSDFIKMLQSALDSMPSVESVSRVNEAITGLQELFAKAEANPVLAGLVPAPRKRRPSKDTRPITEQDLAAARSDIEALNRMSVDEIRANLLDEDRYSLLRLRRMAAYLGIGATEKLSRESLAHQITMKIANYRGYRALSGNGKDQ